MKLKKFSVKNFKSIKEIGDQVFHDDKINCLIGQNGSGKSNILYALYSLKNNKFLVDDSLNEDSEITKNKVINLSAEFSLEKEDEDKLKEKGFTGVKGFELSVQKSEGGEVSQEITPLDYKDERVKNLKVIAKDLGLEIKQLMIVVPEKAIADPQTPTAEQPPEINTAEQSTQDIISKLEQAKSDIEAKIKLAIVADDLDSYTNLRTELQNFIVLIGNHEIEKSSVDILYSDYCEVINRDISLAIKEIFKTLSINLLDLDYAVEGTAPIKDLLDDTKHPFLFDLLKLSGVSATDFSSKIGRALTGLQNKSSETLTDEINKYWLTHNLIYRIERHDSHLCFFFFTKQGAQIELNNLSEGEKWYLKFFVKLAIANKENKKIIWLFDEPGQNLHASSQIDLKNFFEVNTKNSQIIYTTHQPMMMQWQRLERLYVVENIEKVKGQKVYGSTLHQRFWRDSQLVSPLRQALGLFIGEELLTGKEHIVIEGISDYFFLIGWLRYFQEKGGVRLKWLQSYADETRTFVPADGKDNIPLYCLFLTRKTKNNVKCVAIPDSKNDSDQIKKTLDEYGLQNMKELTKDLSAISGHADLKDIEELFDPTEYLDEVIAYYGQNYPTVKFAKNFVTGFDGKVKLIKHIESSLAKENPELFQKPGISFDKVGVAQYIHDKLVWDGFKYSKTAEDNFEKIFTEIEKLFKKK
ncbi:MAG: AAA family ATPase [Patescibacteria group bacterium]